MHRKLFIIAAIACLPVAASAAEMYRCPNAAGKVEYRDRPCDGAVGQKIEVQPNTAGTMTADELRLKKAEVDKRVAAKLKVDDDDRAADMRARQRQFDRCRAAEEAIVRQQAWLGSISPVARQSAQNEIWIQRQRMADYGC